MLFRELSEYFTANSLSRQFRFSFWSLFVYDQLAICYLKLEAEVQPRSMEDLGCQAQDHCTSTSYGKWNYCQSNLEYFLLPISRKASKQDIAAIVRVKSAFHLDYHYHCSQGHTIRGNRQICSTKYRFRQNLFPTVISINLIAIPLHTTMNFQPRARAVFTVTPFTYPVWAPLQIFHLKPGCYYFALSSGYRMNRTRRSSFRRSGLVFRRGLGDLSGCVGRILQWSRRFLTWPRGRAACTISSEQCAWLSVGNASDENTQRIRAQSLFLPRETLPMGISSTRAFGVGKQQAMSSIQSLSSLLWKTNKNPWRRKPAYETHALRNSKISIYSIQNGTAFSPCHS